MSRDRAKEIADQAASTLMNIKRDFNCQVIAAGIEPQDITKDDEGFYTVSYHMAGKRSAWVMQARLRKKYPELDTKVVNVVDMPCDWQAEVRVKLKEAGDEDAGDNGKPGDA